MSNTKYSNLSKNTLLFTLNNFGSKIISFLLVPLYTAVITTEEYGIVDLITSAVLLLIPVLTLNIQDAVLRFSLDKNENPAEVITVGLRQNLIGAAVLGVGLFVLSYFEVLQMELRYVMFLFAYYLLHGLYNCLSMYLKSTDRVGVLVVSSLANTLITCVLNIVLLLVVRMGINGYLIANIAGTAVANVMMLFGGKILRDCKRHVRRGLTRSMMLYSAPLIFNAVAWWINNASDKYVLAWLTGSVALNGIFAVAYKIPTILSTVQTVFYNAWSISAIKDFDENDSDGFIGKIYTLYSCVSVVGCALVMLLNVPLAQLLYAKDFFAAWEYVPFLLLGTVFNGLALFEGCLFTAVKKTREVMYTTVAGAAVNFVANIAFILLIGPVGVSIATMLGYFTTWLVRTVQVRKIVRMRVSWPREIIALALLTAQTVLALWRGLEWVQLLLVVALMLVYGKYLLALCKKGISMVKHKLKRQ